MAAHKYNVFRRKIENLFPGRDLAAQEVADVAA
jgi:hypothetical protein